jgi:hypothetical protein
MVEPGQISNLGKSRLSQAFKKTRRPVSERLRIFSAFARMQVQGALIVPTLASKDMLGRSWTARD